MTATRRSLLAGAVAAVSAGSLGACTAGGPLDACAAGTRVAKMGDRITPIPAGMGRVWFFRDASDGPAWLQLPIYLNGQAVGNSVSNGAFFRDVPPGDYRVAILGVAITGRLTFTMAAGEERFVRTKAVDLTGPANVTGILSTWHIAANLVDPERGRAAVATKVFTDSPYCPS